MTRLYYSPWEFNVNDRVKKWMTKQHLAPVYRNHTLYVVGHYTLLVRFLTYQTIWADPAILTDYYGIGVRKALQISFHALVYSHVVSIEPVVAILSEHLTDKVGGPWPKGYWWSQALG